MDESTQRGSGARLIALLKLIGESSGDCSLKELAEGTGMPASTVHRLLQILLRSDLVERGEGTTYRAGRELFRLASNILGQMHYTAAVRPFLRQLWDKWQETAVFCTYDQSHHRAVVVERLLTPHSLRHTLEPYTELSLSWGSLGRSILAWLDDEDRAAVFAQPQTGPITGTVFPPQDGLIEELEAIRARGCAIYRSQEAELAGVAGAIFRSGKVVIGSIGLTMPARRFDALDQDDLRADVVAAARAASEAFGHVETGG
ncbi:IclR family transcriptional regulator [Altererythrobacter sp. B11]|uniref:IclR family transcriptional regulator n=1 Tax=Altererythrobacter sp. B11 TaxID=2060312 RepID=UPI000DC6EA68|nr:IclR family transcriptional regulator [Altererythrobacter sp. B11]BBC73410.1 IclR family transcriptional regulator [Altererythrobacter sp. B11]